MDPGPGEVSGPDQGRRPVPLGPVGDQRQPAARRYRWRWVTRPRASWRRSALLGGDLAVGDHVVFVFVPSCGHCEPCTKGRPALCEPGAASNSAGTLLSGSRRLHRSDGTPVNHHLGVSGFADYAVVSRRSLVKIDPELPLDEAALFGCAVLTGVGAVVNTARMPLGVVRGGDRPRRRRSGVAAWRRGLRCPGDRRHRPGRRQAGVRLRTRCHVRGQLHRPGGRGADPGRDRRWRGICLRPHRSAAALDLASRSPPRRHDGDRWASRRPPRRCR